MLATPVKSKSLGGCMIAALVIGLIAATAIVKHGSETGVKVEKPKILVSKTKSVEAAVDQETFWKLLKLGNAMRLIDKKTESREDERAKLPTPEAAYFLTYLRNVASARKNKTIVDVPANTPVRIIKTLAFAVPASDIGTRAGTYPVDGSQIRVLDGPMKDFEGWVLEAAVVSAPPPVQITPRSHTP